MIAVDRYTSLLPSELLARADVESARVVGEALSRRTQQRVEFRPHIWLEFLPALRVQFHGKCAYCESPIGASGDSVVEHFRPKSSVDEDSSHPGYFWLAYEWHNMLLGCPVCNRNKRNLFPIVGPRAKLPADSLEDEKPLLIDPCVDLPDQHLEFSVDYGTARARSARGDATINILGLNRSPLITARMNAAEQARVRLKLLGRSRAAMTALEEELKSPTEPYAAVRRALLDELVHKRGSTKRKRAHRDPRHRADPEEPSPTRLTPPSSLEATADSTHTSVTAPRTGYISRVSIESFRSLEQVDLTFDYARGEYSGWQVFLGENGVGKSSILQAIALALIGERNLQTTGIQATAVLRRSPPNEKPAATGTIRVWLDTDPDPITVTFDHSGFKYVTGAEGAQSFVRGYGPTRLSPRRGIAPLPSNLDANCRVENLFDPYVPLCDASQWLGTLSPLQFDRVSRTLKDVLRFGNKDNLVFDRQAGTVKACDETGVALSLDLLSHGQQSALVLATDIVCGIMQWRAAEREDPLPGDFRECGGIILLDEIDAHLHPRWKMEIVSSLKRAFPNIQFLATTHEPLCLRGLEEREIVIVRRVDGTVAAEVSPVSPKGWRVDQLLTSDLFGLFSTIDPTLDAQFQEYYELLAAQEQETLSEQQLARLEVLRQMAKRHNRLGYTRRDQLLYEVIDDYLARELNSPRLSDNLRLREDTKQRLREIWGRVAQPARSPDDQS